MLINSCHCFVLAFLYDNEISYNFFFSVVSSHRQNLYLLSLVFSSFLFFVCSKCIYRDELLGRVFTCTCSRRQQSCSMDESVLIHPVPCALVFSLGLQSAAPHPTSLTSHQTVGLIFIDLLHSLVHSWRENMSNASLHELEQKTTHVLSNAQSKINKYSQSVKDSKKRNSNPILFRPHCHVSLSQGI